LLDRQTGRIAVECRREAPGAVGKWQLETDGVRHSFGQFFLSGMKAGEKREFLLSVEVPDLPYGVSAVLNVRISDENGGLLSAESFPLPPPSRFFPEKSSEQFFCGVRFDVSQAIISSGKLSAVIDANGMRELRCNGEKLLLSGPRLSLWRPGMVPENMADLKLDRLRVAADRFVSNGSSVECHALALPSRMEMDELEFTQRFTPQDDGSLRYDMEFVVPQSFEYIPRLGVEMRLPGTMDDLSFFGRGPHENYPGDKSGIVSLHHMKVADCYPDLPSAVSAGSRSEVRFLTLSDGERSHVLTVRGGMEFSFSALPFSDFAVEDAMKASTMPAAENGIYLHIDCRIGDKMPVRAGLYRMTIFFSSAK
jgi:hypothetical protein